MWQIVRRKNTEMDDHVQADTKKSLDIEKKEDRMRGRRNTRPLTLDEWVVLLRNAGMEEANGKKISTRDPRTRVKGETKE